MITIADNASTDGTWLIAQQLARELADVRAVHLAAKGRGRALHARVDRQQRPHRRLHGRGPVDGSRRPAAADRAPDVGAQRRGDRHPAVPDGPRGSRPAAGAHLPRVQPAAARDPPGPLLRRAVRIQGDARRLRTRSAAATSRTGAGSSTPSCSSWPSGPGCASTRFRSTGSTTRTVGSTSSLPHWRTCAASSVLVARSPAETSPCVTCGSSSVGSPIGLPGVPPTLAGQILRFGAVGAAQHRRLPAPVRGAPRRPRCAAGQSGRAARHGRREHCRQPTIHLRRAGRRGRPPSAAGPCRLRTRSGCDEWSPRPALGAQRRPVPGRGGRRASARQPRRDRAPLRAPARMGVLRAPPARHLTVQDVETRP